MSHLWSLSYPLLCSLGCVGRGWDWSRVSYQLRNDNFRNSPSLHTRSTAIPNELWGSWAWHFPSHSRVTPCQVYVTHRQQMSKSSGVLQVHQRAGGANRALILALEVENRGHMALYLLVSVLSYPASTVKHSAGGRRLWRLCSLEDWAQSSQSL